MADFSDDEDVRAGHGRSRLQDGDDNGRLAAAAIRIEAERLRILLVEEADIVGLRDIRIGALEPVSASSPSGRLPKAEALK